MLIGKSYNLVFDGYYIEPKYLPEYSGIYLVYACLRDDIQKKVTLHRLLYIGQSENIKERHNNHNHQEKFESQLQSGESLCYSCVEVNLVDLDRVENGLIYKYKPVVNELCKSKFGFLRTLFHLSGNCLLCDPREFVIDAYEEE